MVDPILGNQLQAVLLKAAAAEAGACNMDVVVHESIDSTSSWSLQQCRLGKVLPFACFADEQTTGRGRRGKQWLMSPGSNIAMSLTWPFAMSYEQLYLLPLSVGIAIVETLEGLGLRQVEIKWPNDVYVDGKKIAGILIETQSIMQKQVIAEIVGVDCLAVTIGIGLNYDMSALRHDAAMEMPEFTDICNQFELQSVDFKADRNFVALTLLQRVINVCQNFQQNSAQYLDKFRRYYDFCKDKSIEITLDDGRVLSGVAQGVGDNAELQVLIAGRQHVFNSAMVSVKTDPES